MTKNFIYGLGREAVDDTRYELKNGFVKNSYIHDYHVNFGTPCIIAKKKNKVDTNDLSTRLSLHKKSNNDIIILPFSDSTYLRGREVLQRGVTVTKLTYCEDDSKKDIFSQATFNEIDMIDSNKIDDILTFCKEKGSLTLLLKSKVKDLTRDLYKFFNILCPKFKIITRGFINNSNTFPVPKKESITLALTISNIDNCIPIFNKDKIDGIVVNIVVFCSERSQKTNRLKVSYDFTILLSNYEENILFIDGQKINRNVITCNDVSKYIKSGHSNLKQVGVIQDKEQNNLT